MINSTNISAGDLNYDHYESKKYDKDIRRVIPGHDALHEHIEKIVKTFAKKKETKKILDLGIGTGITAEKILSCVPSAEMVAVDFSSQMMQGARKRLAKLSISLSNKSVDKKEAVRPLSVMCIRLVRGREYCLSIPSG